MREQSVGLRAMFFLVPVLRVLPVSLCAKGDHRPRFRFNTRFDVDLRGRSGGVYPRSSLQVELRRDVDSGLCYRVRLRECMQ
jgi:hypothetical protein